MKVSSTDVLIAAIKHYMVQPHSGMQSFVFQHPGGGTEGVSMILLLNEAEKAITGLEKCQQRIRDIGRILYA
jgi:hypothetical protein